MNKKCSSSRTTRPTTKSVGQALADELAALLARVGPDHPNLLSHLSRYVRGLDRRHPDWQPIMERHRLRTIERATNPTHRVGRNATKHRER